MQIDVGLLRILTMKEHHAITTKLSFLTYLTFCEPHI